MHQVAEEARTIQPLWTGSNTSTASGATDLTSCWPQACRLCLLPHPPAASCFCSSSGMQRAVPWRGRKTGVVRAGPGAGDGRLHTEGVAMPSEVHFQHEQPPRRTCCLLLQWRAAP